jgi:hypothetical protein
MSEPLYRVVLTGELISGFSREEVMASLARMFETSAGKLLRLFEGGEHPVDNVFAMHEAAVLQRRLESIGVSARVDRVPAGEPVAARRGSGLRLPSHDDPAEAGLMHCPACGHAQLVAKSCDECGVVFADYNREHAAQGFGSIPPGHRSAGVRKPTSQPRARHDIHADASAGWQNDWLDEGDELPTEQYHVNLFMGMRSGHLVDACTGMMLGRRTRFKLTWTGGAVISPFLWAMHRKMWAWGAVMFVFEVLLPIVLITLGAKDDISDKVTLLGLGVMVGNRIFWPAIMKSLYCRHARLTIKQMHRMAPTYAPDIDIATRGGTSKTSVFVGIVLAIVASLLAWSIVDTLYARMSPTGPLYSTPVDLPPEVTPPQQAIDPVASARDKLLVNENRWVSTRSRLRMLGQQINGWFADRGQTLDPTALDMAQIARALSLDPEATQDGWGREISFSAVGKGYRLISAGPDGEFGSSDDVEYRRVLDR